MCNGIYVSTRFDTNDRRNVSICSRAAVDTLTSQMSFVREIISTLIRRKGYESPSKVSSFSAYTFATRTYCIDKSHPSVFYARE